MKEQLQSIIDGKTKGEDAAGVLRDALQEYQSVQSKFYELGRLIKSAEDSLVYGQGGRPVMEAFR